MNVSPGELGPCNTNTGSVFAFAVHPPPIRLTPCAKMRQPGEFDRFFCERYAVLAGTLAICLGYSWNGRRSRDIRISPLGVGLMTLRLPSYGSNHAGSLASPLKAQFRGLMPLRSRYRWSPPPGTPCFASLRTSL